MSEDKIAIFSEGGSETKNIDKATMYIALIDEDFLRDQRAIDECIYASKQGKPMFAIMHDTVKMPKAIRKIKWLLISLCSDKIDIKANGYDLTHQLNILNKKWNETH